MDSFKKEVISEKQWTEAKEHLRMLMGLYGEIGRSGSFGLMIAYPLKERLDKGERTKLLYDEIMTMKL